MKLNEEGLREALANDDAAKAHALLDEQSNRRCGRCTGCCTGLAVDAINKPERTPCQHEKKHRGCAIYTERPKQCADFMCLWRAGMGGRKDSPDQIGIVFDVYENDRGVRILRAVELWSNALAPGSRGEAFLNRYAVPSLVGMIQIIRHNGTRELLFPSGRPR